MQKLVLLAVCVIMLPVAAGAQLGTRLQAGVYVGGSLPQGDLKDEANTGWQVGALAKMRVNGPIDLRADGAYTSFGSKDFTFGLAAVESKTKLTYGTLNLELNLGPDSAAYPGDNSVSPYITGGVGMYSFGFEATCEGTCTGFNGDPDSESGVGFNIGAGANVPFSGFNTFVDLRFHRFPVLFPSTGVDGHASMLSLSVGLKFR